MFDLSRKKTKPGTFYALAFCVNLISFVMICAAAFTPNWSQITEYDGTNEVTFDKGLVVSCDIPETSGCTADTGYGNHSGELLASFVMMIFAIILAFLTLQLFVVGQYVLSCREKNLGIALTVMELLIAVYLIASLALFEVSITKETTRGYTHRKDTFGFSRGLVAAAVVLYFVSAFFSLGEHFKRKKTVGITNEEPQRRRPSGVFHLRSNHHPNANSKRLSNADGGPSNSDDAYFRTRGTYHSHKSGNPSQPVVGIAGINLWR